MRLFPLAGDMILPILIARVGSAFLAKTMSSAFRPIGIIDLPVTLDIFTRWCKRWNHWNLARIFFHYLEQVQLRTQLWTVFWSLNVSCPVQSNCPSCVSQSPCCTLSNSAGWTSELLPGPSCLDLRFVLLVLLVHIPFLCLPPLFPFRFSQVPSRIA